MGINGRKKSVYVALIFIAFIIVAPIFAYNMYMNSSVSKTGREIEFRVARNESLNSVVDNLKRRGLIKIKPFANIYLKNKVTDGSIKKGVYTFNSKMTPREILDMILKGETDPNVINVTIPEGYAVKQIAEKLVDKGIIPSEEAFIKEAQTGEFKYDFLKDIPKDRPSRLEGYLFPDTYELKKGMKESEIIDRMLQRFDYVYKTTIKDNLNKNNLTLDEVITMASIVEREAKAEKERPVVASVFYNRLKTNMKLQSCATIQYALGETKPKLYNKDLEIDSPYNTYMYSGLPIGPIANPGKSSIEAALNPEKTEYLYFVVKGNGEHFFSKTYAEHEKHVKLLNN